MITGARIALAIAIAASAVACGGDSEKDGPVTLRLVAYDSFPKADTALNEALDEFTSSSGIAVEIVSAGDTGTMVTKAVLTSGNPEGDVMWGVDNTFLSAALDGEIFASDPALVDTGDVCVNADVAWFTDRGIDPPATLDDLLQPQFSDLLVVQNPSTSSVGMAFLLATVAAYGEDGWQEYWTSLRANGVEVVDSWDVAYYERFSGYAGGTAGGDRPLVVSYGTSPPAEVFFAEAPLPEGAPGPTTVAEATCFHQEEYAGVLRGTDHPDEATQLVEFLTSDRFQQELPLTLFVFPASNSVDLPAVFVEHAVAPAASLTLPPQTIAANRATWQDTWTQIVLR